MYFLSCRIFFFIFVLLYVCFFDENHIIDEKNRNYTVLILNILYSFSDSLQEALSIKEKRRNFQPPVYNSARQSEKPLPVLVLVNESNSSEVEDAANDEEVAGAVDPLTQLNLSDDTNSCDDSMPSISDDNINDISNGNNSENIAASVGAPMQRNQRDDDFLHAQNDEIANELPSISDDDVNENNGAASSTNNDASNAGAVGPLIQRNQHEDTDTGDRSLQEQNEEIGNELPFNVNVVDEPIQNNLDIVIKQEPTYQPLNEEEAEAIDNIFNHSYEQCDSDGDIYVEKSTPIPPPSKEAENPYQMKAGDIISGNMPFATNVKTFFFHIFFVRSKFTLIHCIALLCVFTAVTVIQ